MKNLTLVFFLFFGFLTSNYAQVTSVKYLMEYNETTSVYDVKLSIEEGSATTIPQRIQFNAQITVVVPTGATVVEVESFNPLLSNSTYTGTVPLTWAIGTPAIAPPEQPEDDFYSITPDLGITAHYNDLYAGDVVTLFSLDINIDPCDNTVRFFENGVDPPIINGFGDFSNGFTLGSIEQIYDGNLNSTYSGDWTVSLPDYEVCEGGCIELVPDLDCAPDDLTYLWSTGESSPTITVCPSEGTTYSVDISDANSTMNSSFNFVSLIDLPTVSITGSDSICVNGTTTLFPTTGGTWVSSNPIVATVDNSGNVTGHAVGTTVFTFTDLSTGCSSQPSATVWVIDDPVVEFTGDDRLCVGETSTVSPNSGGTWVSNNPSVATIDANTGVITAVAQGVTTFTFTDSSTGCNATTSGLIVDPNPTISADNDTICITSTATLSPASGGTWTALSPSIASLVGNVVTGVASGDAGFLFTHNLTGCTSETLWINVDPGPTTNLTGPDQICVGSTTTIEPSVGGTWSSSDPSIATITNFGTITGVGAGVAVFTFTSASTLCASDPSDPVQVTAAPIVSASSTSLCIGETMNLSPNSGGTWVSSDPSVMTVNAFTGLVTAVTSGSATFTFTSGTTGCSATTDLVTVNEVPFVEFTGPDTICVGFTTSVSPSAGGTWVSSSPGVATVDNLGNVTGISAGNADLIYTNTTTGCASGALTVTVLAATPVSITGDDELCIGETSTLSPSTGGTWISNSPAVAAVDNAGNVIAVGAGQATFSFTAGAGQCSSMDTDPITVNGSETIVLADTTLCLGETTTATTTAIGTWVSNDPAVATIGAATGVVTAIAAGTVKFTFTNTATTCVSDESEVLTVFDMPLVSIDGPNEICAGTTTQLSPSAGGTWSSNMPSVATINNSGLVIGITAGGPVTFTWTDNATGCTSNASDPVTVIASPLTIVTDDELCIGETTQLLPSSGGTWVSADPTIITVTSGGLAQAVDAGVTVLTHTSSLTGCSSEPSDPITVHGYVPTVITGDANICIGNVSQMSPSSGGTWTSSDAAVATIDNSGLVTGINAGSVTFTFTPTATGCPSLPSDPILVEECMVSTFSCEELDPDNIFCDLGMLGLFQGSLNADDSPGNQPQGVLCDGEAGNIMWLGFFALEGDYEIVINTSSCIPQIGGIPGVQIGLYSSCNFDESNQVFCDVGFELENEIKISSDILTPGNVYYMYIDGIHNSTCDFDIKVEGSYDNTFCTDLSKVTGTAYIDANENGIYDANETPLRNVLISLFPGNFSVLTNDDGEYIINTPKGGATLTAQANEGDWVEDFLTLEDVSVLEVCVEDINFGFVPSANSDVSATLSVSNTVTRCDWETRFYIIVENTGSEPFDGLLEFEFDDETSFFNSPIPNLTVNGNKASTSVGSLQPFTPQVYQITLKMPSGSSNLPILDFKAELKDESDNQIVEYSYSEQLRCSYDPNDKREYPDRVGEENLTLMDEDIEYTIRFQNNGNDTAFLVKIVDELDPNIDSRSIRVVNSSHSVETCIEDNNLIFIFENINLVDSTTNYDASQGFVTFRCKTKDGRAEFTPVYNSADIIFDSNAPIITNSTINTLVSVLCTNVETQLDVEICEGENFHGYEQSGTYTEIIPLDYGCDSMVTINLDVQGITYSSQNIPICEGDSITLNGTIYTFLESQEIRDSIENANGCLSNILIYKIDVTPTLYYEIDTTICDGMDYEGYEVSGVYTVESFDPMTGCDIYTTIDLEVLPLSDPLCTVGIDDLIELDIQVYPNPAKDIVNITTKSTIESVSIYSYDYAKVVEVVSALGTSEIQLNTSSLNHGLYFLGIKSKGKVVYKKLIIK